MSSYDFDLPDIEGGTPFSAADQMQIVNALRELQRYVSNTNDAPGSKSLQSLPALEIFPAEVQATSYRSTGYGDPTYTDSRYYFRRLVPDASMTTSSVFDTTSETQASWKQYGIATNFAELPKHGSGNGSHALPDGTRVTMFSAWLRTSAQKKIYWFNQVSQEGLTFRVDLVYNSGTLGNNTTVAAAKYDVKYPSGTTNTIGTNIQVDCSRARAVKCTIVAGTAGTAYYKNGVLSIWDVDETQTQTNCT